MRTAMPGALGAFTTGADTFDDNDHDSIYHRMRRPLPSSDSRSHIDSGNARAASPDVPNREVDV